MSKKRKTVATAIVITFHIAGALSSVNAIMTTRTAQGAIAWAVALNTFPYGTVPAYWIFGRDEFKGYVVARRDDTFATQPAANQLMEALRSEELAARNVGPRGAILEKLAMLPFTRGNQVDLLIDGEATFDAIFDAIDNAEDYILVQFYILRDDELGTQLKNKLLTKAKQGVRVYVLFDEIGSYGLPESYLTDLRAGGVKISRFHSQKGDTNRFQLNFRNHRKIVIVDGHVAFVGGHNVGDEYLGKDPEMSPWRDTHVAVRGPAVQCIQIPFGEDWHWATGEALYDLNWTPVAAPDGQQEVLSLATGPADPLETCTLFFLDAINSATERLWIASPYFVPDEQFVSALQLASLRGVDVRILIPEEADSTLVWLSSFSYLDAMEKAGIRTFRYQPGFLHQKVLLVDDDFASVGTANFDNRSFRLNFEITIAVHDSTFAAQVATMLETDLEKSVEASAADFNEAPFYKRLASRFARLLAPVQ
ncbi:cardiolipin synthase [Sulfuriroseicoccus oceanibius]|uniref:Cardiolipin synthase n=1 Tax=Sulfuriroseicoccus oceanibius TaxID=2707525 RepID=A0A6B3LE70_9BACT|nr:cardiolipin synthase [Sulfuriroseicoccus oceanibius]QQL44707.1 cardiolipin synthase [Sulfuriroseicoccus oceanibius]